jgi:flagellar protein FliS
MQASQPHQAYKQVHVETASQGKLIVMLYDAAIKRTEEAANLLGGDRKLDVISNNLIRAQDIIAELRASLNMKVGEIATNLDNVYDYVHRLLIRGNVRKEKAPLEEAVRLMRMLRDTWKELFDNLPASEIPPTSREAVRGTAMLNVHG